MSDRRFLDALWRKQATLGLSNNQLAAALGVTGGAISLLKTGKRHAGSRQFVSAVLRTYPELIGYLLPAEEAGSPASDRLEPVGAGRGPPPKS